MRDYYEESFETWLRNTKEDRTYGSYHALGLGDSVSWKCQFCWSILLPNRGGIKLEYKEKIREKSAIVCVCV